MSGEVLLRATEMLIKDPKLAESFSRDPTYTIERLGLEGMEPADAKVLASLNNEELRIFAGLVNNVRELNPDLLRGHSGGFIY